MLTQVHCRTGTIDRVARGTTPVVELDLEPGQYIAHVEMREARYVQPDRKTVDWRWTAYIVTPLGGLS